MVLAGASATARLKARAQPAFILVRPVSTCWSRRRLVGGSRKLHPLGGVAFPEVKSLMKECIGQRRVEISGRFRTDSFVAGCRKLLIYWCPGRVEL